MRLRKQSWRLTVLMLLCCVFASGCAATRPVLVREGDPLRVGPDVRGRVYVRINGVWTLCDKPMDYPEGWYLVPPSFADPEPSGVGVGLKEKPQ